MAALQPKAPRSPVNEMEMRIQSPFFDQIKAGKKVVEARLNQGRISALVKGGTINFIKGTAMGVVPAPGAVDEAVAVTATEIKTYPTFAAFLKAETLARAYPGLATAAEAEAEFRKFYSPEKEAQSGIIAITLANPRPAVIKPRSLKKPVGALGAPPAVVAKIATLKAALPVAVAAAKNAASDAKVAGVEAKAAAAVAKIASVKKEASVKKAASIKSSLQKALAAVAAKGGRRSRKNARSNRKATRTTRKTTRGRKTTRSNRANRK